MQPDDVRARAASARVARLATVSAAGTPHLVPICFALVGEVAYTAVDHKRKRGGELRRVTNVEADGRACLLIDHYADDWSTLWWVRLDGTARVVHGHGERDRALAALAARYPQYVERPPAGPVLALDVTSWTGWSAG